MHPSRGTFAAASAAAAAGPTRQTATTTTSPPPPPPTMMAIPQHQRQRRLSFGRNICSSFPSTQPQNNAQSPQKPHQENPPKQQQQQQQQQQHRNHHSHLHAHINNPTSSESHQHHQHHQHHHQHHHRHQTQQQNPHRPGSVSPHEPVYVLTLLTDPAHHARMTALRAKYFPRHLNKLDAHLTLFHALPAAKLESAILPALERVAAQTAPFAIRATRPFRLGRRGIAVALAGAGTGAGGSTASIRERREQQGRVEMMGGDRGRGAEGEGQGYGCSGDDGQRRGAEVHSALLEEWRRGGWLSEQDARLGKGGQGKGGGWRGHYTIMNTVDDEDEVEDALEDIKARWRDDQGMAQGLGLWRYERGWWIWEKRFDFTKEH